MKTASPAAATALAALYAKDGPTLERSFGHLTPHALEALDHRLLLEFDRTLMHHRTDDDEHDERPQHHQPSAVEQCHLALAHACIRRKAHRLLDKYTRLPSSKEVVDDALKFHALPVELQEKLATRYGRGEKKERPTNWYEALEQLKSKAASSDNGGMDKGKLWQLILDHPMTSYVPVQCQSCGRVVPDQYPLQQTDAEVGLREVPPTGEELELRGGWFRGPRKAVVFEMTCIECGDVSRWYRSGHPKVTLNPHKWGRLCGEQEDLRLALAAYLEIPVRMAVPLDWDHVWSEYRAPMTSSSSPSAPWQVHDGSARNFCCRLDEGIGSWTGVWAVHPNPDWCGDVTRDYLTCQRNGGRADDRIRKDDSDNSVMKGYKERVLAARDDASGKLTQAKTVNGHLLHRAHLSEEEITMELRRAAQEYGTKEWWQLA